MLYSPETLCVFHRRGITNLLAVRCVLLLYMETLTGKGTTANLQQQREIAIVTTCSFWLILLASNDLRVDIAFSHLMVRSS